MNRLYSIESIHKVIDTAGSHPVLVTCNDFQDWVCKYDHPDKLFNEYLASRFATEWGIKTPPISFVEIGQEHIPTEFGLPKVSFNKPCFGSLYLNDTELLNDSFLGLFKSESFKRKLNDKEDLLKIALFDIWLSNEDRTPNNLNLLLRSQELGRLYFIYIIDHTMIFNTGSLKRGLYTLNEYDTILNADLIRVLFRKKDKLNGSVDSIVENFYLCVNKCERKLDEILEEIPDEWQLSYASPREILKQQIFSQKWKEKCVKCFRDFVQILLMPK